MRCESTHESAWRVRVWSAICAANDGLVRLNGSMESAKAFEVLFLQMPTIPKLGHHAMLTMRLSTMETYLFFPGPSVPVYSFAKGISCRRRVGECLEFTTCLGYPL